MLQGSTFPVKRTKHVEHTHESEEIGGVSPGGVVPGRENDEIKRGFLFVPDSFAVGPPDSECVGTRIKIGVAYVATRARLYPVRISSLQAGRHTGFSPVSMKSNAANVNEKKLAECGSVIECKDDMSASRG